MASGLGSNAMARPRANPSDALHGGVAAPAPGCGSVSGGRSVPMLATRGTRMAVTESTIPQQWQQQQMHGQHMGQHVVQPCSEVVDFLKQAGLEHYTTHFFRSGFDDMETLQAISDEDMKDMGIPNFHILRMRKQLQEAQRRCEPGSWAYDPNHPVAQFMEEIGMGQYVEPLMRGGFDDLDVLCDIEDADMKDLGIPRGHALKLRKRLREYQLDVCQYVEDHEPQPHPRGAAAPTKLRPSPPTRKLPCHVGPVSLHMPTAQMKSAVERSWEQVEALGTFTVGEILHRKLFRLMPEAMQLFPSHVRTKYREWSSDEACDESNVFESPALRKLFSKFVNAVGCAVAGLHDNTKLVPMLMQLGRRHVNYGVHRAHFEALGRAFSLTLHEILGVDFTKEVEEAWSTAYHFMTSIMLEGLNTARPVAGGKKRSTGSTVSTMHTGDVAAGFEGVSRVLEEDIDEFDEDADAINSVDGPSAVASGA